MTAVTILNLLTYANFTVATVALVVRWLALNNNGNRYSAGQYVMFVWVCHVWLFFAVSTILRAFFDYSRPTLFMSVWSGAVYFHAIGALAMDGYYHLKRSDYRPRLHRRPHEPAS